MMITTMTFLLQILFAPSTTCSLGALSFDPTCFFSLPYTVWFPLFLMICALIILFISVIYMVSPLFGRNDIRLWCKLKIYEILITVFLAAMFLALASVLYTMDPASLLYTIGLLPSSCAPGLGGIPTPPANNNLYSVAVCDMYQYNHDVASFSQGIFYFAMVSGFAPVANFNVAILTGGPPQLPAGGTQAQPPPGLGFNLAIELIPIQVVFQYLIPFMSAYFAVDILAQVQQLLLASSMIIFSAFMIIGFFARAFSITKTFGGSMIAFGLGIGFIYPLVTLMSYGFLDVAIQQVQFVQCVNYPNSNAMPHCTSLPNLLSDAALGLFQAIISIVFSRCNIATLAGCQTSALANAITPFMMLGGFVAAGLILIPLLNLVIVDAFIVDVAKVIGEKIDLLSLLTRIV